jgi:hypothetical protein
MTVTTDHDESMIMMTNLDSARTWHLPGRDRGSRADAEPPSHWQPEAEART